MTRAYYACAVTTGREHQVAADMREITDWVWLPQTVASVMIGPRHQRTREWRDVPLWPGYLFAALDADAFFAARNIKGLHRTKLQLTTPEVSQLFSAVEQIDAAHAAAKRRTATESAAQAAFAPGQGVTVLAGLFAQRMAVFSRMVRRDGKEWAEIKLDDMGGLPGILIDPCDLVAAQ